MTKTLITGGAGFVGSNLAREIKPSILLDWRKPGYLFKRSGGSERIEELYDREVKMEHVKPPEWRKEAREGFDYSIEKIGEELGYEPELSLREGIKQIFERIG